MSFQEFEDRKRDHLLHALDAAHQASGRSGIDSIHLVHEALPELNLSEVKLTSTCLGRPTATPFYIAGMTAGHPQAAGINLVLAQACEARGWVFGVGSQRRELQGGGAEAGGDEWRNLRRGLPRLTILANLGVSQLITAPLDAVRGLVESLSAQALVVHANPLQEAIQPEGTPNFKGAHDALRRAVSGLGVPVILKETGCGFSAQTLSRLRETGLAAIDVSGLGGTHWGRIEGARSPEDSIRRSTSETFANWGEPTVDSVVNAVRLLPGTTEVWASGGVRSGLDAGKLIALGARRVGYAQPALQAALDGREALERWMERQELELRIALFCTGCDSPESLRKSAEKDNLWKNSGV